MFVASFLTIARLNPGFRHIRWMRASYPVGLLTPLAEFLLPLSPWPAPFVNTTYSLISQAGSGVLLVAAGLMALINALHISDAMSDPLTGLPNRRALNDAFQGMATRPGETVAAIAVLDLDRFKRINDVWGHGEGDEALRAVAQCLEDNRPADAVVARLGGEEFVLLMPWGGEGPVRLACEKLRMAVAQLAFRKVEGVTVSIGATSIARKKVWQRPSPAPIAVFMKPRQRAGIGACSNRWRRPPRTSGGRFGPGRSDW